MQTGLAFIVTLAWGCGQSSLPPTVAATNTAAPATTTPTPPVASTHAVTNIAGAPTTLGSRPDARRCLPVVSQDCGCVYSCGVGVPVGTTATWHVTHAFWPDLALRARIVDWCVAGSCTEAFAAQLVCDGICAPVNADATCHFDPQGACVTSAR